MLILNMIMVHEFDVIKTIMAQGMMEPGLSNHVCQSA